MTELDFKRRLILKGMGALGAGSILVACGGGSSNNSSSSGGSSGTGGIVVDPTNASKGSSAATCATGSASVPLIIDASVAATGIPQSVPIYAYIIGMTAAGGNTYYWFNPAQGVTKPVVMSTATNTNAAQSGPGMTTGSASAAANYPTIWSDFSIPLDRTCATVVADLATFNATNIPGLGTGTNAFSGRIAISVGKPILPFTPRTGSNATDPTPSNLPVTGYTSPGLMPNTPGSLCLYDWLEFSYDVNGALDINTTQVDQFGFPISMQATGTNVQGGEQGLFNKTRSTIFSSLSALNNTLFSSSVAVPTTGVDADAYPPTINTAGILRALAPANTTGASSSTYLNTAISNALNNWKSNWVSVTGGSNVIQSTYYGQTASDGVTLNFYTSPSTSSTLAFTFNDITTYNVLNCSGTMAGTGVPQVGNQLTDLQNTGKQLLAAFNRGTVTPSTNVFNQPASGTTGFLPSLSNNYGSSTIAYNVWAKQFHQFSSNGLAYGFSYDDVGNLQPSITTSATTSLRVQLGTFS